MTVPGMEPSAVQAVLELAEREGDPRVKAAVREYAAHSAENRPYENTVDAEEFKRRYLR